MGSVATEIAHGGRSMMSEVEPRKPFSIYVGPVSRNVGRDHRIFSADLGPNSRMLSGRPIYVLGPIKISIYDMPEFRRGRAPDEDLVH